MKTFRAIYYGEVFLNLGSAVLAIFAPALFLSQFTPAPQSDVAVEMMRWFGGLMVVLTWVGWRILRGGDNRALSWMLEGFLVGEIEVKGIMQSRGAFIALVLGPDGKTYTVRVNDRLLDGSVRAITSDTIVLMQDVNDPLSLAKQREVRKTLRAAVVAK